MSQTPMQWIGPYAAAASLVWVAALIADTIHSFRRRKLWFPCKYSALNAVSLNVIGVAVKMSMDLMPSQFGKLNSAALLGVSTIHFMPSLGSMSEGDMLVNLLALGILIVTVSVDVIFQVVTAEIGYPTSTLQTAFVSLNVYSFIVLISSAITVSASKRYLEHKYKELHGMMSEKERQGNEIIDIDKLKSHLNKYWMMAKTGSPQFVMARSETCYILGLISSAFLLPVAFQLQIYCSCWRSSSSDYQWPVRHVYLIQVTGVCLCVITTFIRFIHAISVWRIEKFLASIISLGMKNYEVKRLVEWKKKPPPLQVRDPKLRKLIHMMNNLLINVCICAQLVIVMTNKLLGLISTVGVLVTIMWFAVEKRDYILIAVSILFPILCFKKPRMIVERFFVIVKKIILKGLEASVNSNDSGMQTAILMTYKLLGLISIIGTLVIIIWWGCVERGFSIFLVPFLVLFFKRPRKMILGFLKWVKKIISKEPKASANPEESQDMPAGFIQDFKNYALLLEGETIRETYIEFIHSSMNPFMKAGAKHRPRYLMDLLENSTNFNGVLDFESNQVPTIILEEPPSCWTLPIVVLTSISLALPKIEEEKKNKFLRGVIEGLTYVRLVEKSMDDHKRLVRSSEAAEFAWTGVEFKHKWLHVDLNKLACESQSPRETLQTLAKQNEELLQLESKKNPNLSDSIVVANSMYKVSNTLLLQQVETDQVFDKISVMVADIYAACLTNLPHVILGKCYNNAIEDREHSVEEAARLYGETQDILKALGKYEIPSMSPDQSVYIEEWRALLKTI